MKLIVQHEPCLLLETSELVYAFVNEIPTEKLTCPMPYAIPTGEMDRIQQEVCRELDPEDPEIRFFFTGVPVGDKHGRLSCLASCLLYAGLPVASCDVEETLHALKTCELTTVRPFHVIGLAAYSIGYSGADHYTNLTQEFSKLEVPVQYQMQLVEIFSNFGWYVDRLGNILRPLAEKLKPLLMPWVEAAAGRRAEWEQYLAEPQAVENMLSRVQIESQGLTAVELVMRYVFPLEAPGEFRALPGSLHLHMGTALIPGQPHPQTSAPLENWEFTALKLLSSPDRMAIISALTGKPKSIQDLSHELGLNPGSVFRDLNNLFNVGILTQEIIGGRNYYRANLKQIEKITDHLVLYLRQIGTNSQ